jgi:hypothetical protein
MQNTTPAEGNSLNPPDFRTPQKIILAYRYTARVSTSQQIRPSNGSVNRVSIPMHERRFHLCLHLRRQLSIHRKIKHLSSKILYCTNGVHRTDGLPGQCAVDPAHMISGGTYINGSGEGDRIQLEFLSNCYAAAELDRVKLGRRPGASPGVLGQRRGGKGNWLNPWSTGAQDLQINQ